MRYIVINHTDGYEVFYNWPNMAFIDFSFDREDRYTGRHGVYYIVNGRYSTKKKYREAVRHKTILKETSQRTGVTLTF